MQSPTNPPTGPQSTSWSGDDPFQSSPNDPTAATGNPGQQSAAGQARDTAAATGARAKDAAAQVAERAKQKATETGEQAKAGAADEIERTAQALEAAADDLDDASMQRELFLEAAHGLMEFSDAVRGRSVGSIVSDLSAFGRRNPYGFLGGAALAGFAVARFARASARSGYRQPQRAGTPVSSPELRRPTDE